MKKRLWAFVLCLVPPVLSACGGGGGGSAASAANVPNQAAAIVLTLSTQGTLTAPTQLGRVDVSVHLPPGVSVNAAPRPGDPTVLETAPGVVVAAAGAAGAELVQATYSEAANVVTLVIGKAAGFSTGSFAIVTCSMAPSVNPSATAFSLTDFASLDPNGAPVTGLTAVFAAQVQ